MLPTKELDPGVGLEPTWAFADGLQNRSNRHYGNPAHFI